MTGNHTCSSRRPPFDHSSTRQRLAHSSEEPQHTRSPTLPLPPSLRSSLSRKPRLCPQSLTKEEQDKDAEDHKRRQRGQQTDAGPDAQIHEQRSGVQDAAGGDAAPQEIVAREQAGGVGGVRQRQVHEHALEHDEEADGEEGDADAGDDPVDACFGRPGEDEEADGDQEGGEEGGDEAAFGGAEAVGSDAGFEDPVEVGVVDGDGDEDAGGDGEEGEAHFAEVETVVADVDDGEGLARESAVGVG